MWLKVVRKSQAYVNPDLDPVLLVPGVAGSVLHAVDESGHGERVWIRLFGADYKLRTKLWSLFDPSTGKTVSLDPKTNIVVPEDRYGLYAIDVLDPDMIFGQEVVSYFHDMIVEMLSWGYQEGKTLFGFGYDFRQSNRYQETMDRFAAKLESVYTASGGKRINIISHSMGGILVKCFMSLNAEVFEKYVKNWISIAAPFQGAPGYITSTFLNGMSFVDGWEQNFFISKWSMHQLLIECPSIYELMPSSEYGWEHLPLLQIWREKLEDNKDSNVILESYSQDECIQIFNEALSTNTVDYQGSTIPLPFNLEILKWANETRKILSDAKVPAGVKFYNIYGTSLDTPHIVCYGSEVSPIVELEELRYLQANYICVEGDGTVPIESAKADGLKAEARVGVPGEHRGILCERHLFRILKHWLKAGEPDPYYDPVNDFVILPTAFEVESHKEKQFHIEFVKEEWEFVSADPDGEQCNLLVTNKAAHQPSQLDVFTAGINDLNQANHCLDSRNSSVTANYICVEGDGTVPIESAKADGLKAEARVGVPGEHRGILCERHLFRILKHWLKAGEPDPYYDPVNDFVILPTAFEVESHKEKQFHIEFVKEEWEFVSADPDGEQCNLLVTNKAAHQPSQLDVFTAGINDLNQANHCLDSRNSSVTVGA